MKKQSESEKLKSILVIVVGFLVFYTLADRKYIFADYKKHIFYYIAFGVGLLSLISTAARNGILFLWGKIAQVLGWINTRVLLSAVFYLFLFPIAIISRLFSKNMLQLKKQQGSVFIERNHQYTKEDLENTW
jgi:hypothetical protein